MNTENYPDIPSLHIGNDPFGYLMFPLSPMWHLVIATGPFLYSGVLRLPGCALVFKTPSEYKTKAAVLGTEHLPASQSTTPQSVSLQPGVTYGDPVSKTRTRAVAVLNNGLVVKVVDKTQLRVAHYFVPTNNEGIQAIIASGTADGQFFIDKEKQEGREICWIDNLRQSTGPASE